MKGYRGIYASPCDVRPNRDMIGTKELATKKQKLWIVEFRVKNIGNGCAVVKAFNPKEAETLLKSEGAFNGTPCLYDIIRVEEIVPSPDSMLLTEQLVTYTSVN